MSRYNYIEEPPIQRSRQTEQRARHSYQEWQEEPDEEALYRTRPNTSTRRYQMPVTQGSTKLVIHAPKRKRQQVPPAPQLCQQLPKQKPTIRVHWLAYVGTGMMIILVIWIVGGVVISWWQSWQDDLHYGRPRTFQIDARVGHNDQQTQSHFIVENLNKQIVIVEFPGGDATKAIVYVGPALYGSGQDLAVVTLSFKDLKGDGKPDMIVSIQGSGQTVFINDGTKFRPA